MTSRVRLVCTMDAKSKQEGLKAYFEDCKALGKTRFIVIGNGAILESVSSFERVAFNEIPGKGTYATVSTEDKTFECHVNLDRVKEIKMLMTRPRVGDYDLYVSRFINDEGNPMMSAILHGDEGDYDEEALAAWKRVLDMYGETQSF